jgi:hypothetical protein
MKKVFGRKRPELLLPVRLRNIYNRLLDGMITIERPNDRRGLDSRFRLATFLCEVENEVGKWRLAQIMRRVERFEQLTKKAA